jgi:TRAP transporter 4TM/12TM fusion protein
MGIPVFGRILCGTFYYYLLYSLLAFNVFMGLGASAKLKRQPPPWYDYVLSLVLVGTMVYFLFNSEAISMHTWEPPPETFQIGLAVIIGIIAIEAGRRVAGWGYVGLLIASIIYPLFADKLPGRFVGLSLTLPEVFADFAFGANGLLGIPAAMFGDLILGFYFFAGFVMGTGAGEFFVKLATSLLGHVRGGPAKVSVLSSALLGTLSGSTIANITSTGAFTIPAMKKLGYEPHYAAAVEACSSNIGDTMPPIMGGMVFMAAIIAGVDYTEFVVAAVIPAVLYVFALEIQVDSYAVTHGLKGIPKAECPKLLPTLKEGWIYLVVIAFLSVGMVYMRWGAITPIYAVVLMLVLVVAIKLLPVVWTAVSQRKLDLVVTFISNNAGTAFRKLESALMHTASLINFGVAIFLSMAFVLVGLIKTGTAAAITAWVVSLGGGLAYPVLFIATAFSIIMGTVGLQRTAFLFLSVTAAPAIATATGVPIHLILLFIIYQAGYGAITPPVAVDAFVAASIAGADPMKTALTSCRIGVVLLMVPFFFVLQPALAMQGPVLSVLYHLGLALLGIFIMTSGFGAYMIGLGKIKRWERILFGVGGFLVALPETITTVTGLGLAAVGVVIVLVRRASQQRQIRTGLPGG